MKNSIRLAYAIFAAVLCGSFLAGCANEVKPPITDTPAITTDISAVTADAPVTTVTTLEEASHDIEHSVFPSSLDDISFAVPVIEGNLLCNDELDGCIYLNENGEIRIKGTDNIILPSRAVSVSFKDNTGALAENVFIAYVDRAITKNSDGVEFCIGEDGAYLSYNNLDSCLLPKTYFASETPYSNVQFCPQRLSEAVSVIIVHNGIDSCILTILNKGETINTFEGKFGDFRDVDYANDKLGYAVSYSGTINGYNYSTVYKTIDGGKTFEVIEQQKLVPGNVEILVLSEDQIIFYGAAKSGFGIEIVNLNNGNETVNLPNFVFEQMQSWEYYSATTKVYFDNSTGIIEVLVNRVGTEVCLMYYLTFDGGATWYPYECHLDSIGITEVCLETLYNLK